MTALQVVAVIVVVTGCLGVLVRLVQASDRGWNDRFEAERQVGRAEISNVSATTDTTTDPAAGVAA